MKQISFQDFDKFYQETVQAVYNYWTPQMQMKVAAHCYGWAPGNFDFRTYLQASSLRFYKTYCSLADNGHEQTICDVGSFWGVFPLTLKALGYNVTITESLQYYSHSFDGLFNYISDKGVNIIDYDPFQYGAPRPGRFDFITVMAVLEHYPHSLKGVMGNIVSMMNPGGRLYIEVPNIAYWPKRVNLMFGGTPLAEVREIFMSEVPFIGHHHEFTISELRDLAHVSGLSIISEDSYNYSPGNVFSLEMLFRKPISYLAFSLLKDSRECLAVLCKLQNIKNE